MADKTVGVVVGMAVGSIIKSVSYVEQWLSEEVGTGLQ